jgi:hypothetical protein
VAKQVVCPLHPQGENSFSKVVILQFRWWVKSQITISYAFWMSESDHGMKMLFLFVSLFVSEDGL